MSTSPYRGLRPFEDSESDVRFFFGRESEREIIAANLMASRLTVLYGETGVGKSSVLRAGVAHHLRAQARANAAEGGKPGLAVVVFDSWRDDPVAAIARAVGEAVREARDAPFAPPEEGLPLADRLKVWTDLLEGDLYLVLDQAEEYFLYHRGEQGPGSFAEQLPKIVGRPGLRVNVLLALREDSLARLDIFKARIPGLFGNYLRLDHLDRAAARRAIVGPIERYDEAVPEDERVEIEPALVECVLDEIAAGRVELGPGRGVVDRPARDGRIETPYLQLVMQRLWDAEQEAGSRVLRLETFRELGGADEIVRAHLGRALESLQPEEQDVASSVFDHLVTPTGTKIAHGPRDLAGYAGTAEEAVVPVLAKLAAERILRPVAAADGSGDTRYEIFHDVLAEPVLAWKSDHDAAQVLAREREAAGRRHRRLVWVAAAAVAALAVVAGLAVFALTQRSQARAEARVATSRELAASAVSELAADPELSLLLALRAARTDTTPQAADALRQALLASRVRAILTGARGAVASASFSPDGRLVVTASRDGAARLYTAAGGPALHVLRHGAPVTVAVFGATGTTVLTASRDGTARLWATQTGRLLHDLRVGAPVVAAALAPGGTAVVTVDADGAAVLWDARSGARTATLRPAGHVVAAVWSPDGRHVATGSADQRVRLWLADGSGPSLVLKAGAPVNGVAFSSDGTLVLGWTYRSVVVWRTANGALVSRLVDTEPGLGAKAGVPTQVEGAAFSPDGTDVLTWSVDGGGRVYDVATGRRKVILFGHTNYVNDASFSWNGKWIVTASSDRSARTWQASDGQPWTLLLGHSESVNTASFNADGSRVVTASDDGTARVWDPGVLPGLTELGSHTGPATVASLSRDGTLAVSGGQDGTVRVWRVPAGGQRLFLQAGGPVVAVALSPDGATVLGAAQNGTVHLWGRNGRVLATLHHGSPVAAAALSPDGRMVVTAGSDGRVRLWSAADGTAVRTLDNGAPVTAVAVSPDGRLVLASGNDGVARIWSARTGALVHELRGHKGAIVAVAFGPDGKTVATAGEDHTARLWSVSSGALLHVLSGHTDALTGIAFSKDGTQLVTSSWDHDARIWNTADGTLVHVLRGHFAVVAGAGFSPDGQWVVTAGPGSAGLWSVESGALVSYLRGHTAPLTAAQFTPDGTRILTASKDGTVRLYRCEICGTVEQLEALARARLAATGRRLTADERQRLLGR